MNTLTTNLQVIDLGSHTVKSGVSGSESKDIQLIPNITGYIKYSGQSFLKNKIYRPYDEAKYKVSGVTAQSMIAQLSIRYPMENGLIVDVEAVKEILGQCMHETSEQDLRKIKEEKGIVITQSPA
jgi:actin-related protein